MPLPVHRADRGGGKKAIASAARRVAAGVEAWEGVSGMANEGDGIDGEVARRGPPGIGQGGEQPEEGE
jgi:hypothetical protein